MMDFEFPHVCAGFKCAICKWVWERRIRPLRQAHKAVGRG